MEKTSAKYVPNPVFDDPCQAESILAEMPGEADYVVAVKAKVAADVDGSDSWPLLTEEQMQHQFRKMNFLKKRAAHTDAQPGDTAAARLICERLIRANLRILFDILNKNKHKYPVELLQDLRSDGHYALWQAVEKFNYDRPSKVKGQKTTRFIAYARRVIRSKIAERLESVKREIAQQVDDYVLEAAPARDDADERLCAVPDLEPLLSKLSPREKQVVCLRHGLPFKASFESTAVVKRALTLTEVGLELKIKKTRVHQLEQRAYLKLQGWHRPS